MSIENARTYLEQVRVLTDRALQEMADPVPPPITNVLYVKNGDNLQAAIDAAATGTTLRVQPGTYDGVKMRPGKALAIEPDTDALPSPAIRIGPEYESSLIKLRPTANGSGLYIPSGSIGCSFRGLQPLPGLPESPMIQAGSAAETVADNAAKDLAFVQCLLLADPVKGGKRGLAINCGNVVVTGCYIDNFFWIDDSWCIGSIAGPGPYTIVNNYLRASGINVLFGGDDPKSESMKPRNLTFQGNVCSKRIEWKGQAGARVKNAFELKNIDGALINGNLFEMSWTSGQSGDLVLFTPRNQAGTAPYSGVSNVVFTNNVIRSGAGGMQIMGDDDLKSSQRTTNVKISNCLYYDIDPKKWTGSGRIFSVTRAPVAVEISHVTAIAKNHAAFLALAGPGLAEAFVMRDSILYEGSYGISGANTGQGSIAWDAYVTAGAFDRNVIAVSQSLRNIKYPGTTSVKTSIGELPVDETTFDITEKYKATQTTDARRIGADVAAIRSLISF